MEGLHNFVNNYLLRKGNSDSIDKYAIDYQKFSNLSEYIEENGERLDGYTKYITDINKVNEILEIDTLEFIKQIINKYPFAFVKVDELGMLQSVIIGYYDYEYVIMFGRFPFCIFNEDLTNIKFVQAERPS